METSEKKPFDSYCREGEVVILTTHYSSLHEGIISCENFITVNRAEEIARNLTNSINEASGQNLVILDKKQLIQDLIDARIMIGDINNEGKDEGASLLDYVINYLKKR